MSTKTFVIEESGSGTAILVGRGRSGAWTLGRRAVRQKNPLAVARRISAGDRSGPSRIRSVLFRSVGQHELGDVPSLRSSELQRHTQLCCLGIADGGNLVRPRKVSVDSWRVGTPYPFRYSPPRTLVLSDAVSVASLDAAGERDALGSARSHDPQLHRARDCVCVNDWIAKPQRESGVTAQNCWGK